MPKKRLYKDIAERVIAATNEFNDAIMEAFEHPQSHVYLGGFNTPPPVQLTVEVTRITNHRVGEESVRTFDLAKPSDKKPKKTTNVWKRVGVEANPKLGTFYKRE